MAYYNGKEVLLGATAVTVEGGGTPSEAVLYTPQTLTTEQKEQARANIGAAKWVPIPIVDTELDITSGNPIANSAVARVIGDLLERIAALEHGGGTGGSGITVTDDGDGNVTIETYGGASITDDGNGNVVIL